MRESTLPAAVKDAAMANLSTLVTTTSASAPPTASSTASKASNDQRGCCHGNCTHVWNYETGDAAPVSRARALAARRSLRLLHGRRRRAWISARSLPHEKQLWGIAAADGQMGQIMKPTGLAALAATRTGCARIWPGAKRALEFAWVPGGWDADRDGVMEGVQHNTYDVEFYGPNPLCGIYYLGALRAGEEMARAVGDAASAGEYRAAVRQRQQVDRREPVQRRILHPEDSAALPKDKIANGAA